MSNKNDVTWKPEKTEQILRQLQQAEKLLVGVGAGFPLAAGIDGLPIDKKLPEKDYWPFWLPYIETQRLHKNVPPLYTELAQLLLGKDYFIIDSNPDGFLQHSGLDLSRIYKVQGDMARVQCSKNCRNHAWIGKQHF